MTWEAAPVGAEMFLESTVGMAYGETIVGAVARQACRLKEQFEVHHIVDNHRARPSSRFPVAPRLYVPALYDAGFRAEACRQRLRGLNHGVGIGRVAGKAQAVAEAAAYHKPYVVVPFEILCVGNRLGVLTRIRHQGRIACKFIEIPHGAGEESTAPVGHIAVEHTAVGIESSGIMKRPVKRLDCVNLHAYLHAGVVYCGADRTLRNIPHAPTGGASMSSIRFDFRRVSHPHTAQGWAIPRWSRGRWAIYGYTMAYRYTGNPAPFKRAADTFEFMRTHLIYPSDNKIPYWDMD